MKKGHIGTLILILSVLLVACNPRKKDSQATVPVVSFYSALVGQDRDRVSNVVCAAWEREGLREVDAFLGVKSDLVDFSCSETNVTDTEATVVCKGKISASYGTEITDFPLENRKHKVIKEQGEWRLCGF